MATFILHLNVVTVNLGHWKDVEGGKVPTVVKDCTRVTSFSCLQQWYVVIGKEQLLDVRHVLVQGQIR